ncbi:hypothetical protein F2P56_004828 [Juglans regia]|uniref:Neprosin PEP catalytic domain-containing protein n=2 Tax=Juglans regia TaxID=51240 RepID=A0A833Y800_JUGRE|nr:uncharacterized protein LOC109014471 isoform X1 [Juglans regia]KAF5478252.1 hypothetical protein F2P56_004828 [Juglans regia]
MDAGFRTMAAKYSKNTTVLLLVTFALLLDSDAVQGWGALSKVEDLELDRQLKLLNKPAIMSFQTEYGDIVDCVDIYKQLAFDHPLLKNHTIQMKPETIPDEASRAYTHSNDVPNNISCPHGSVPIRRSTKEDLLMENYLKSLRMNYKHWYTSSIDISGHHSAALTFESQNYGGKARINVWNPAVTADQFSLARMCIVNGHAEETNSIQAGWGVNQFLYANNSRLYTFWTADGYQKSGCYNVLCPGFVQVSSEITLGLSLLPTSTYGGPQYDMLISLYQDQTTGNWWFMFQDKYVGYWPKEIFTSLAKSADFISWGGQVYSPIKERSPEMGSGRFPEEGYGKSAYIKQIKVVNNEKNGFVDPTDSATKIYADKPFCYNAIHNVLKDDEWGHHVYFGGHGNCTF